MVLILLIQVYAKVVGSIPALAITFIHNSFGYAYVLIAPLHVVVRQFSRTSWGDVGKDIAFCSQLYAVRKPHLPEPLHGAGLDCVQVRRLGTCGQPIGDITVRTHVNFHIATVCTS